ncbi:MAG: FAD-dependent oxidoreductase, partial [Clostridiales bacterium]|nr:FAD-dependent oxidoreductase [Clostridiales bacterium]
MKIVIIGGVAGGASAAARLRRLDERAEIIMFERGEFISFANCGLPYYISGVIEDSADLTLQTPESFNARFNVDVRALSEVVQIDRRGKAVTVRDVRTGGEYVEPYDKLILSPGAKPVRPPIEGADNEKVFTVRTVPDAVAIRDYIENKKPSCAVVIGGGYIGVEMAENLKTAGLDVTIVEMTDHLIASLDYDMACDVHNYIQKMGVHLLLSNGVVKIADRDGKLDISLQKGELTTDMVIMAVGVRPETELASAAGLELNERGAVVVSDAMQTSDPDIYAVGDAVAITEFVTGTGGYVPLAGPANRQGRIAADNICGIGSVYKGTQGSAVLKIFDMTVAVTGITESVAKRLNLNYDKSYTYSASNATYYPGGHDMSVKTVFDRDSGKILGAQLVGFDGVCKRCDVFSVAVRAGMTAGDLTELELCYAPPFSSAKDPVNFAGFVIENQLSGICKSFYWHDVAALPRDGSVTLLDVREPEEYAAGRIDGFINIDVDELRGRIGELDSKKPAYVYCRSGLRSYIACRNLM